MQLRPLTCGIGPQSLTAKYLSHCELHNIPRSIFERGMYRRSITINKLAVKILSLQQTYRHACTGQQHPTTRLEPILCVPRTMRYGRSTFRTDSVHFAYRFKRIHEAGHIHLIHVSQCSVAGQCEIRRRSRKIGRPATGIAHRRQKVSQASEKMRTCDATSVHLQRKIPSPATQRPPHLRHQVLSGDRGMPEGIDKKGYVRKPCAGSGARTDGSPMTPVIRTFRHGRALRRVFDDRYGPKGRKREESGAAHISGLSYNMLL